MNTIKPKQGEIWLLLDSLTFGGIETHVLELASGLKHFHFNSKSATPPVRVVLITQYNQTSAIIAKLSKANIPYSFLHQLTANDGQNRSRSIMKSLYQANQIHQPTLIHAHGYKASIISKLVKLISAVTHPVIQCSTFHAGETPKGVVRLYDLLDRYTAWASSYNLVVSQLIKEKIPAKSAMLNNFVSTDNLKQSQGSQLAFVGRLSHEKAPDRFIDLAQKLPNNSFDIYGSGPLENTLKAQSCTNVQFHGHQHNMDSVWPNVGLLIITSRYEGLPMAALEAMARGIPVLAMNVGNLNQLIDHKVNGFIADTPEALFECMRIWFSLSIKAKSEMSQSAIDKIQRHYSTQAVIPQLLKVYDIPL